MAVAAGRNEHRLRDLRQRWRGHFWLAAAGACVGVVRTVWRRDGAAGVEVHAEVGEPYIEEGACVGAAARRDGGETAGEGKADWGDQAARVEEARHGIA